MWREAILLLAGFSGGLVNAVGGGGTLLSYPALMWSGLPAITANATSCVALWPGSLGGALGFRKQMSSSAGWMLWLILPSLLGGWLGSILLLRTDPKLFAALIPWLVGSATALLALQEPFLARFRFRPGLPVAMLLQLLVAIYGGYFGAGIGILMLAVLGLLGETDLHRMNGWKNLFACCINGVSAAWFVYAGAVVWHDVLIVASGALLGGGAGAKLALRVGRAWVRRFVIVVGICLTVASCWPHS